MAAAGSSLDPPAARAGDVGTAADKLVVVARDRSRGIKLAYRAAGDALDQTGEARTLVEVRSANDPVPLALAVAADTEDGARSRGPLLADGLAAVAPEQGSFAGAAGTISTVACTPGAAPRGECRCTAFGSCRRRVLGRGTGTKLTCRGGEPVPCVATTGRCFGGEGCLLDARHDETGGFLVCAGDSNTVPTRNLAGWYRQLSTWLGGVETLVTGWPGTRALDDPGYFQDGAVSSRPYLANVLAWPKRPDVLILAWGSNDVPVHTPKQIANAIDDLVRWMRSAGIVPLVATVPWRRGGAFAGRIGALNGLLAARHGSCLIDFTTITPPTATWYVDRVHLNAAAQERRAIAATYALKTLPRSCAAGVASRRP